MLFERVWCTWSRTWPACFSILLFSYSSYAQTNAIAPPRPTLIQQDVDEVSLDITVRDKHRRPVRDLTAADIRITDDGKPVVLKSFHLASADAESKQLRTVTILLDANQQESARAAYEGVSALVKDLTGIKTYYSAWQVKDQLVRISGITADVTRFQEALRSETLGSAVHRKEKNTRLAQAASVAQGCRAAAFKALVSMSLDSSL